MILLKKKAIQITEELNYLKVVSRGDKRDFAEVILNANRVNDAIQKSSKNLALLDYRETVVHLPQNETYNLDKVFEIKLTSFKNVRMVVLINNRSEELGGFWTSICEKRGMACGIFKEFEEAERWLLE